MRCFLLVAVAASVCLGQSPPTVPYTTVQISGTQNNQSAGATYSYRAYQASAGDEFRIVCQEPCSLDPNLIYAKYAGMKAARLKLLQLVAGVDHVPEGGPFDYHIQGDSFCGPYTSGETGDAGFYQHGGSFGCFWDVEKPNQTYPLTVANAQLVEAQLLFVHEYGHTLFYGRHYASYEDAVKAFSMYVSGIGAVPPGKLDFCDPFAGAYIPLVHELCLRHGFHPEDFGPAMRELDRTFQAGIGDFFAGSGGKPETSIHVFKRILDSLLGADTRDAFAAAGYPPYQIGDDAVLPAAGGSVSLAAGAVVLSVPAGAVAVNTAVMLDNTYSSPNVNNLSFQQIFRLEPPAITFSKPVQMTVHYDPASLTPAGANESALRLWRMAGTYSGTSSWVSVAGQHVDPVAHTVSAPITATGQYGYFIQ